MEWQPIETAPKDGERVIVIVHGIQFIAFLDEITGDWCVCSEVFIDEPTHWMPLTEPPK